MRKHVWGLYRWGTGYAGFEIRIPVDSEEASASSKEHPASKQEVLESVIKIVNDVKTQALNTRLFKELCKDMNAVHAVLLFYTSVCWLSKENISNRVIEVKDEIKLFLEI